MAIQMDDGQSSKVAQFASERGLPGAATSYDKDAPAHGLDVEHLTLRTHHRGLSERLPNDLAVQRRGSERKRGRRPLQRRVRQRLRLLGQCPEVVINVARVARKLRPGIDAVVSPSGKNVDVEVIDRLLRLEPTGKEDVDGTRPQSSAQTPRDLLSSNKEAVKELLSHIGPAGDVIQRGYDRVASDLHIERKERKRRFVAVHDPPGRSPRTKSTEDAFAHGQAAERTGVLLRTPEGARRAIDKPGSCNAMLGSPARARSA
jgi:hypothetical protein